MKNKMTRNKKLMLRFEFDQNEINELVLDQQHDEKNETRIEPPWVGVDESGRLHTQDLSIKNRDLSDNPTSEV
jgi:hypothetical protein